MPFEPRRWPDTVAFEFVGVTLIVVTLTVPYLLLDGMRSGSVFWILLGLVTRPLTFFALFIPVFARRFNPIHTIARAALRELTFRAAAKRLVTQFVAAALAIAGVHLTFGDRALGVTAFDAIDGERSRVLVLVGQLLMATALASTTRENDHGNFLLAALFAGYGFTVLPIANPAMTVGFIMTFPTKSLLRGLAAWALVGQLLGTVVGIAICIRTKRQNTRDRAATTRSYSVDAM